jgi:acyl CoA:acetate/3-ketoacid CoA transferase beta subunit
LPATALRCVARVITDLGVFDPKGDHFVCVERATGVGNDEVRARTGAPVVFA